MINNTKKFISLFIVILCVLSFQLTANAWYPVPDTSTGDIYLKSFGGDDTYVFTNSIINVTHSMRIDPGVTVKFQPAGSLRIGNDGLGNSSVYLDAQGTAGSPIIFTSTPSATTTWQGIYIDSYSSADMTYCFINNEAALRVGNYSSATVNNTTISSNGTAINAVRADSIYIRDCTISSNGTGINIFRTAKSEIYTTQVFGDTYAIQNNTIFPTHDPAVIHFCSLRANTTGEIRNSGGTVNAEFNYFPGQIRTVGALIDISPSLNSNPLPFNLAGASGSSPIRIGAGGNAEVNYSINLPGVTAPSFKYFLVQNGNLVVTGNTRLSLGRNLDGTSTPGGTILGFSTDLGLIVTVNGELEVLGSNAAHVSKLTSSQDLSGVGTYGQWNNVVIAPNASATFNYARIASGKGLTTYSDGVTITYTYFVTMNDGLICNSALPYIVTSSFRSMATNNIIVNNPSTATLNAEYCYYGKTTPNYWQFAGTGIIDYEPWFQDESMLVTRDSAPDAPTLNYPVGNLPAVPIQYNFGASDIGMYGDSPVYHQIIVSTANSRTAGVVFIVTTNRTANGYQTYPTTNALEGPGPIYSWWVRSRDPDGTDTWSAWSNTASFTVQGPEITINITANVARAGAGDAVDYTVSYNNTGGSATNAVITNVLPVYVYFSNAANSTSINIPANAQNVTISVYDANVAGNLLGQGAIVPNGSWQNFNWATAVDPLVNTENMLVRRIEIDIQVITANANGFINFRTRVR